MSNAACIKPRRRGIRDFIFLARGRFDIDWRFVPVGHDWVAIDQSGAVWSYSHEPALGKSPVWFGEGRNLGVVPPGCYVNDWAQAIFRRPEVTR